MRSPASESCPNGVLNPTPRLLTAADAKTPCQTGEIGAYARAEGSSGAAQSREALGFRNRSMKVVERGCPPLRMSAATSSESFIVRTEPPLIRLSGKRTTAQWQHYARSLEAVVDVRRDDAHHERPLQRGRMVMAPYGLKSQYCRTQSAKATNLLSDGGVAAARVAASPHVLVTAHVQQDRRSKSELAT